MQTLATMHNSTNNAPWYRHRWPWFLMLGPLLVVLAGVSTSWLAYTRQDALVVDDYYKQGKAINQDLRRDKAAASLRLSADLRYDPAAGRLTGRLDSPVHRAAGALTLRLVHSTQPEKDVVLTVQPDQAGAFTVDLGMLEQAHWQVQLESAARDWRLVGEWNWPKERAIALKAMLAPAEG